MNTYKRGSEWRRWDLHIHTPFTRKNDNFSGGSYEEKWENYFQDILNYVGDMTDPLKSVVAIGITDYFSIENYKTVINNKKIVSRIPLILPNIELRILPTANRTPVNIHVIFNPDLTPSIIEDCFLSKLVFRHDNVPFPATQQSLTRLGKIIDSSILDDNAAERKAIDQYVVDKDQLQQIFNDNPSLKENALIVVSNNFADGASGVGRENENALTELRKEIYRFTDAIFSANPQDRDYFLGEKEGVSKQAVIEANGKLMACLHGSDAHENSEIFEPDEQRYCWIKADPTFNGLKQILCEPKERVRISSTRPQAKASYQVIDSINIDHEDFQKEPIVFNDKLNCIIGGKSTGKSILLHNLARAIDPSQVKEKCMVTSKKGKAEIQAPTLEIETEKLKVTWADGSSDSEQAIIYIPQTYLNRLSDSAEESTEIDEIIEKVLLDRVDSQGNKLSVRREKLSKIIDDTKAQNAEDILSILRFNKNMVALTKANTELGGKAAVEREIDQLTSERNKILQEFDLEDTQIDQYDALNEKRDNLTQTISNLKNEMNSIGNTTSVVEPKTDFICNLTNAKSDVEAVVNNIVGKANEAWQQEKQIILQNLSSTLQENMKTLKKCTGEIDAMKPIVERTNNLQDLNERIIAENEKLNKIIKREQEILDINQELRTLIDSVADSCIGLKDKYKEFAQYVKENTHTDDSGLQFDVHIPFRKDDFLNKWTSYFRASSPQNRQIIDVDDFVENNYSKDLLIQIIDRALKGELLTLKAGENTEAALRGILDDWYIIKYKVQMDNDSIDEMSPGKKALVLLQLLVDLAESECPILIDQPEDDLDNRSIFEQLIPFIKNRKIKRQIIIVTHNANIVVGADAEEVIVANQCAADSPNESCRFEYRSGSIENNLPLDKNDTNKKGLLNQCGIQQHICDVLEGGKEAFEKRRNQYRL